MDDPRILRVITVGLVLAALAVVYFLFTGGFSVSKSKVTQAQPTKIAQSSDPVVASTPSPSPVVLGENTKPSPTPSSAYAAIANRNQASVKSLPSTGFPAGLAVIFSISAVVSGFSLRKFPE